MEWLTQIWLNINNTINNNMGSLCQISNYNMLKPIKIILKCNKWEVI